MGKRYLIILILFVLIPWNAQAASGKEFTTSVIYGALAGTLVGAATLAFTTNPGDNLNNVARGASYGLYAGILLGVYVSYGLDDDEEEVSTEQGPVQDGETPQEGETQQQGDGDQGSLSPSYPYQNQERWVMAEPKSRWVLVPVLEPKSFRPVGASIELINVTF
ncbi:MAG: hypothetical protein IT289_11915 [Oligoflexia bacterium]|nr:hypothetical protein [Oligoflexia bacterium]